ncbi:hypothetical protein BV378_15415 [Nostoc sp. RF31YmG]|jgi:hypothetical protein|nr:hypothetical protein BV378_15415 [Nostoc sp. RF31YmG]
MEVKEYAIALQDISVEELKSKSIEELKAIAAQLTVRQFEDKTKQIEAILWGREFFATEQPHQQPMTEAETVEHLKTEKIKENWSLRSLKVLCLEMGIAPVAGNKAHKQTWIDTLVAAEVFK